ncbi:MAG: CotH kinase family protein [Bacteroidales bacterium]|nr:CotH kinase family protein [Bacteroidales bacterium]
MNKKYYILIICLIFSSKILYAQNIYDINTVKTIYLNFYEKNWDDILDTYKINNCDDRVLADLIIDGELYDSVGVRFKGNSSYHPHREKNPFNIKIDYINDKDINGYTTLKLSNMFKDPSCLREVLSYEVLRNYMPAPQANYVVLYINDNLHGLYTNVESVNKSFVKKHFGSKDNSFFKCDPITITGEPEPPPLGCLPVMGISSPLIFMGDDTICYEQSYDIKSDFGWIKLRNLIFELNINPTSVNQLLDVDKVLWMLAFNNIFVNLDSYSGSGHNYYIYEDAHNRFNTIIWDLNENLGVFSNGLNYGEMFYLDPFYNFNDKRPLIKNILEIPDYQKKYFAHYRTIINEFVANEAMINRAIELQNMIDTYVANDANLLYTYTDFIENLNENVNTEHGMIFGINNLLSTRYDFFTNIPEINKEGPDISNVQQSDSLPASDDSVCITAQITNVSEAWLEYKNSKYSPFQSVKMYDDGNHNDTDANDGIYGATIPSYSPATTVYYYIYAINADAGKFFPERAGFECFSYSVESCQIAVGDIVINEIMASNSTTQKDQDEEYDDWIELYNNTNNDISLNSLFLSDEFDDLSKWTFSDTIISANSYIIIWADDDNQNGLHANFKLSKDGEELILSNIDGTLIDSLSFNQQYTDTTYGRYPNATGDFYFLQPTFCSSNQTLNIINLNVNNDILIYPNPTSGIINIEVMNNNKLSIEIINISNQLIYKNHYRNSIGNNIYEIDLSNIHKGIYFVKIYSNNFFTTEKIVIGVRP